MVTHPTGVYCKQLDMIVPQGMQVDGKIHDSTYVS